MSQATASKVATGKWVVDPIHSSVGFETTHLVVSKFRGSFKDFDVNLTSSDEGVYLEGAVRVNSVETRVEDLTQHLQTADFFDAENHPEISIKSNSVEVDDNGNVRIEADLTIRGTTKPVVITGTYAYVDAGLAGNPVIGLDLETVINRHDFGVSWNAPLPSGGLALADDVKLTAEIELVPVSEED